MYQVRQFLAPRLRNRTKGGKLALLSLAFLLILGCIQLFFAPLARVGLGPFSSGSSPAMAAPPVVRRIDIPYFNSAVPFNRTAIFWFGSVSSSDNYIDVRLGYNSSELYVDLHIVDRYLWYDPNAQAPDLASGDTASLYLDTAPSGQSAPDRSSFKFVAQVDWYQPRTHYQQTYQGNGATWVPAPLAFTSVSGWRGSGFNGKEDSGWTMTYHLPFASLGLAGAPAPGTRWGLAVKVHNQDNAADTPLSLKWWPESFRGAVPGSWGDLVFGLPRYQAPRTTNDATYTIRNGLNNQVVTDGMVGGALGCFNGGANRWSALGSQSYPGATRVNIQNEWDISDFNCFSKFYISFPLGSLPKGQAVVKATVTLYEYGNAGKKGVANPSCIQVAVVGGGWDPATLAWNNAPLVQENIGQTIVNTVSWPVPLPGKANSWDVSRALASAYAAGQSFLQLVFYSSDSAYSTGKYFYSSTIGDWNAQGRPTLQVTLGTVSSSSSA